MYDLDLGQDGVHLLFGALYLYNRNLFSKYERLVIQPKAVSLSPS